VGRGLLGDNQGARPEHIHATRYLKGARLRGRKVQGRNLPRRSHGASSKTLEHYESPSARVAFHAQVEMYRYAFLDPNGLRFILKGIAVQQDI